MSSPATDHIPPAIRGIRSRRLRGIAITAMLALACGDAFGPADVAGTYQLSSANGLTLPAIVDITGGTTTRYEGGILSLGEDARWQATLVISREGPVSTVRDTTRGSGSFTVEAPRMGPKSITMINAVGGESLPGVVSTTEITMTWSGIGLLFRR